MTLQQLRYALTIAGCGSMNEAAKRLFLSQPSLSETVKELEQEIGLQIFMRSNRGIIITPEGEEFLGYARQVIDQYGILKARYVEKQRKEKFSVSMQHYTFAVKAFVETVKKAGMDSYEFAANETTTYDVMENVRNFKSEIGVLYLNDFNEQVLMKIIREKGLEFEELFACDTYVYLWSGHPLAGQSVISMEELDEYPCLSFDQGRNSSLYLAKTAVVSAARKSRVPRVTTKAQLPSRPSVQTLSTVSPRQRPLTAASASRFGSTRAKCLTATEPRKLKEDTNHVNA